MDRRHVVCAVVVMLVVGIGIGIGIGFVVGRMKAENPESREADEGIRDRIMNEINSNNIRNNLKILTTKPHVAGTENDLSGAQFIQKTWLDQGLDTVKLLPYKVLLQHPPHPTSPDRNKVEIFNPGDPSSKPLFESASREDPFNEEELLQDGIPPPYLAYSATGEVQGDLVFVHYCRVKDLNYLTNTVGINLKDKILIARMSGIPRFNKVKNAEEYGAAGLILYPDPEDYSSWESYPNGTGLPSTAAPRGSILSELGDPLTPGYPSKDYAYRLNVSDAGLPKIIVHPIGYADAKELLSKMEGEQAPRTGTLDIEYRTGPGFKAPYKDYRVRIVINSNTSQHWTYNVMGYLKGEFEPDRYILIGNHRDAWGLGSVDPTSGTACLLELSRVFGKLKQEGWRPRRTIIFGSWGAEEFGLIGSVEYTEEFYMNLVERAVAYLNIDIAVAGSYVLRVSGSPHLANVALDSAKTVRDPSAAFDDKTTLYNTMSVRLTSPGNNSNKNSFREIPMVLGGSDYYGFVFGVGVPTISAFYSYNFYDHWRSFYPLYHTSYETFRLMDELIDPGFKTHQAVAQIFGEMLRRLGDEYILPIDVVAYADYIQRQFDDFKSLNISKEITNHGFSFDYLEGAITNFSIAASNFNDRLKHIDKERVLDVRKVNDQMALLDRAFLDREGLPRLNLQQRIQRHVLFAPTNEHPFPGLYTAMKIEDEELRWQSVDKQLSVLTFTIESAASTLLDVVSW
ncbi:N-acetylated-alpha-linked acidic dipeptidase 2-like [Antedon mediterranea]|uniref:N-acetylated-alpha-linked acidic dipeptidase 2-like n=1 Tax=Antedon mediterranea TaxID=105859 RepID=UPI003AF5949C